jgi:prepilin-type processing-associated H-X9-DG protein
MDWIVEAAELLLDKARLETSGNYVHLQAKASVDLAEGIKLLAPAVTVANVARNRAMSTNNLKQIALAFHNYHDRNKEFPASVLYGGATGKVPYSWRVAILPYLEQNELYKRYNFDEPWDGPNNRNLLTDFTGEGTALAPIAHPKDGSPPTGPSLMAFHDGTSNTILTVEARREIPWTKPEDIPFDPNGPLPELGGFTPDGFNTGFADGSVRYVKKSIAPVVLKALITRAGGEVISSDQF